MPYFVRANNLRRQNRTQFPSLLRRELLVFTRFFRVRHKVNFIVVVIKIDIIAFWYFLWSKSYGIYVNTTIHVSYFRQRYTILIFNTLYHRC